MITVSEDFDYFLLDNGNGKFLIKSRSFNRLYNLNKRRMKCIYGVRIYGAQTGWAFLLKKSKDGVVSPKKWILGMRYVFARFRIVDEDTI